MHGTTFDMDGAVDVFAVRAVVPHGCNIHPISIKYFANILYIGLEIDVTYAL